MTPFGGGRGGALCTTTKTDRVIDLITSDRGICVKNKGRLKPQGNASGFSCFQVNVGDVGFVCRIVLNGAYKTPRKVML